MINTTIWWMLVVPFLLAALSLYLMPKLSYQKPTWDQLVVATVLGMLISAALILGGVFGSIGVQTSDVELWNGEVTGKTRDHGSYLRPYECNCRPGPPSCSRDSNGREVCTSTTVCDTCYENRYTVNWECQSNVGSWNIKSLDETSSSVYLTPDPARYTSIQNGDPVAIKKRYTNYIKAVPSSLFRPAQESLKEQFAGQIPPYPINVFDFYRVNRVVPVGVNIPNLQEWNDNLSVALKRLGPQKQANAVIVITKSNDPNYFYALQDAWLNGKKNDIVLVIGAPDFPAKASWVNVMALTQDNLFQVRLRDAILDLPELSADSVIGALLDTGMSNFNRKSMKDFKYLEDEIDPPSWVIWTTLALIAASYAGFLFFITLPRSRNFLKIRFRSF